MLWQLAATAAIVNLLALLAGVGWLVGSGRLDRERWEAIRTIVAAPPGGAVPEPEPTVEEPAGSIRTTAARIEALDREIRQQSISLRRLRDEKEQLDRTLEDRRAELDRREAAFTAEREAWEASTLAEREARIDTQFRKTVRLLESVPPKQAKDLLLELVRDGDRAGAVAYLDAMSPYKASSVLKTFKGEDETRVAAVLLEELRVRGQRAGSARAAVGASPATTDGNASRPSSSPAATPNRPVANIGAAVEPGAEGRR
jgi:hypothetical protein